MEVKGFDEDIAQRIAAPQAQSTARVYDKKWSKWLEWCQENNVDSLYPDSPEVARFLVFLFKERSFKSRPLKATGPCYLQP